MNTKIVPLALLLLALFLNACAGSKPVVDSPAFPGTFKVVYYPPSPEHPNEKKVTVDGREIFVPTSGVVAPSANSLYLLSHTRINPGETVLDIGTGSGVQAIFAADHASHVVATDIDEKAVKAARKNIQHHGLTEKVEVRLGDLFAPIKADEKFDVILFNINFPFSADTQWLWEVHKRFFKEVKNYLKPNGRIYYQSGLIANTPRLISTISNNELVIMSIRMDYSLPDYKEPIVFMIKRKSDIWGQ